MVVVVVVTVVVVVGFVVVVGDVFGAELGLGELEGVLGEDDGLLLGLVEGLEEPEGDVVVVVVGLSIFSTFITTSPRQHSSK